MKDTQRFLVRIAASALFAVALAIPLEASSAPSDEEIANGLDPITTGKAVGYYSGGTLLAGEYCPMASGSIARATDEEIANGLDPITLGQAIGNFAGGTVLKGEYLPGASPVLTAERR